MNQNIDLMGLMPNFSSLFSLDSLAINSEQLSAIFVSILFFVSLIFLIFFVVPAFLKSKERIKQIKDLIKDETEQTVSENRESLKENIKKNKDNTGHLWLEFDKTLLEVSSDDKLYNTLDSSYFFNTSTLAPEITESRLLAAVPGFLTGIGVLGTFIGLQLGLSELNISPDVSVDEMKLGLSHVISGAKIAFMSSVWGVGLSLFFNIIEKLLERSSRKHIQALQEKIDSLFPRLTPEYQLQQIAENSAESRESLQHLAEKIGEKVQESMSQFAETVSQPMRDFTAGASDDNQQALGGLIESFMDKFGAIGDRQSQEMQGASEKFTIALNSLDTSMTSLLSNMENLQGNAAERENKLIKNMSSQVDNLVENSNKQNSLLADAMGKQLTNLSDSFEKREIKSIQREEIKNENLTTFIDHLDKSMKDQLNSLDTSMTSLLNNMETLQGNAAERENKLIKNMSNQVDNLVENSNKQNSLLADAMGKKLTNLSDSFEKREIKSIQREEIKNENLATFIDHLDKSMKDQLQVIQKLIDQGGSLQNTVKESVERSIHISDNMKVSASEMKEVSQHLKGTGNTFSQSVHSLSGSISNAVITTEKLADKNKMVQTLLETQQVQFNHTIKQMSALFDTANHSFDTMKTHQKDFTTEFGSTLDALSNELTNHVNELTKRMSDMLDSYAKNVDAQTTQRFEAWVTQTTQYTRTMQSAIESLASIIDDIQDITDQAGK